mgnify:CR=1 FL=1
MALIKVVVRSLPFHRTFEPETKPDPRTVNEKAEPPTVTLAGDKEVKVGVGLFVVKVCPLDVPPPGAGLKTVRHIETIHHTDHTEHAIIFLENLVAKNCHDEIRTIVQFCLFRHLVPLFI